MSGKERASEWQKEVDGLEGVVDRLQGEANGLTTRNFEVGVKLRKAKGGQWSYVRVAHAGFIRKAMFH